MERKEEWKKGGREGGRREGKGERERRKSGEVIEINDKRRRERGKTRKGGGCQEKGQARESEKRVNYNLQKQQFKNNAQFKSEESVD